MDTTVRSRMTNVQEMFRTSKCESKNAKHIILQMEKKSMDEKKRGNVQVTIFIEMKRNIFKTI